MDSITDLRNNGVKNIVRGIINETDRFKFKLALDKIKKNYNPLYYNKTLELLRTNSLFKDNSFSRDFTDILLLGDQEVTNYTEIFISNKINKNSKKLNAILMLYVELFERVQLEKFEDALLCSKKIMDNNGTSIFLIRILHFIRIRTIALDLKNDIKSKAESVLIECGIGKYKYLDVAIKEMISSRTDYFNIIQKISERKESDVIKYVVSSFVNFIPEDEMTYLKSLNSYYSFSLLDALVYMLHVRRLGLNYAFASSLIDKNVIDCFDKISQVLKDPKVLYTKEDEYTDLHFFRESFLIQEAKSAFDYRLVHSALFNNKESKATSVPKLQYERIEKYFNGVSSLVDLRVQNISAYEINYDTFNPKNCGSLENTSALMFYLQKKLSLNSEEEHRFIELMTYTHEVGVICPEFILQLLDSNKTHEDLGLVLSCLKLIKTRSQLHEHELRRKIQDVLLSRFNGDFIKLLDHFNKISTSVTEHIIFLCDETFLSKLFLVTTKPIDAIKTRAEMLKWYGVTNDDQFYVERAKNLLIDIQISKEKGTIDDSRIYVDPVKYTQWINNNISSKLVLLLESLEIDERVDANNININWQKVKGGLTYIEQISAELLVCYEEFCQNKLFGIASYLGRRIRHGTLKGTGLKEISELHQSKEYQSLAYSKDFTIHFESWINNYSKMLDELRDNSLHVKSKKKPNGLIVSEINTNAKKVIADFFLKDVLNSYEKNKSGTELPYIITDYCWRLIEDDLESIRKELTDLKSKHVISSNSINFKNGVRHEFRAFSSEINNITAEKFRIISSWFRKPSIASPSTDLILLFKAVISEVTGLIEDFSPRIIVGDTTYEITGGQYFVIYDALYLLIHNVAKHGDKSGDLSLNIKFLPERMVLRISVSSNFKSAYDKEIDVGEIEKKFNDANNENAHIEEGRSGIKKLRRMEEDKYISNLSYLIDEMLIKFSFDFQMDY